MTTDPEHGLVVSHRLSNPPKGEERTRCLCGSYRGERFKGIICQRCGVEIVPKAYREPRFTIELSYEALQDLLGVLEEWRSDGRRTWSRARVYRFAEPLKAATREAAHQLSGRR